MQTGINGINGTATVTTITANVKDARATPASPSQDAGVRERCAMLGIEWLDKAPQSDAAAADLLAPEIAVRLGAVPVSIDGTRLIVAMLNPLDTAAVDEIGAVTSRSVRRIGLEGPAFRELMRDRYGTTAAVSMRAEGKWVDLVVDDRGPGIPDASLDHVTKPFVRLEESRNTETGGHGLGLTITRAIAERHGGELVLENRKEGGLRATLRLPTA